VTIQEETDDKNEMRGGEDFKTLFEEGMKAVQPGAVVSGIVVGISPTFVTVDIGYKSEGQVPLQEFIEANGEVNVKIGDRVDVYFESTDTETGTVLLSKAKAKHLIVWDAIEQAYNTGGSVEGVITGKVKGGLRVDVGIPAFLPSSHIDLRPVRNVERFMGEKARFGVLKYNRARGNVVVSRKAVIEQSREALKKETLKVLEEGVILEGTVKNLTGFGAFVDLGGIDGLLHITDMAWGRLKHPSEVIKVGDVVKVVVLKIDPAKERVSLGMKQMTEDPWKGVEKKYPVGSRVKGQVVTVTDYGAFVEIEHGIEGLIHVSEMAWTKKVTHPSKVLKIGEVVEVQVLGINMSQRRIALGLKQVLPNPWEIVKEKHPVGSIVKGKIRNITDFGIFVGIDEGIDGLVHISDLHWTKKIKHPSELYNKGDEIEAKVLGMDVANERFSLGMKQLTPDPWESVAQRYPVGSKVEGTVTSVPDFGVFVCIEEGIEGLIHVSQVSHERVDKPSQLYKVGDRLEAEVIHVEPKAHKIGLSIKALKKSEEQREMEAYLKKEREGGKFSFESILSDELRLDRDEDSVPKKGRG
jgi:small subunit ribosomal protein S1